jgi:hypothetical protein
VIADVTTLNFNVLFEIGYAIGLEQPVVPIRDTSITSSQDDFRHLGLLDTIGYLDFYNADGLATGLLDRMPRAAAIPSPKIELNRESPIYVIRGHIATEGDVRLMATLRKSALNVRSYDHIETPRLSLYEARKQVAASLGVLVHLMGANREGAQVHNARCALIAGIAMASGKTVLMLQEDVVQQPIDYRDVVASYTSPNMVPSIVDPFLKEVIALLQDSGLRSAQAPENFLEQLDLGDVAAENESRALKYYFVRTSQFNEAKRGTARLVVGRKGAGKTALFYGVRDSIPRGHSHLALELKPEGHQFTLLREVILSRLSVGLQESTLTAFWNYILLCEIAETILEADYGWAQRDEGRWARFQRVSAVYGAQVPAGVGDFSERLLRQVERMTHRFNATHSAETATAGELTEALFRGEIKTLDESLAPYLKEKDDVWVLVDNLDKGWPTRGTRSSDILILRSLLEATRKLQRQLDQRGVGFHALVFLRNDIYEHLLVETPDRGKDTAIALEWDDIEVFKELVKQRVKASTGLTGAFDVIWPTIADPYIGTLESFAYMVQRTLMRPRDLLALLQRSVGVAINRGHARIEQEDLLKAEESYSEDMLLNTAFELRDINPKMMDVLYLFGSRSAVLSKTEVDSILSEACADENELDELSELLVWFGFLGISEHGSDVSVFAYQVRYNLEKLLTPIRRGRADFVIHPAFRRALSSTASL